MSLQVHYIDFDDENNMINKSVFVHREGEIWNISASTFDPDFFATCYNKSKIFNTLIDLTISQWQCHCKLMDKISIRRTLTGFVIYYEDLKSFLLFLKIFYFFCVIWLKINRLNILHRINQVPSNSHFLYILLSFPK